MVKDIFLKVLSKIEIRTEVYEKYDFSEYENEEEEISKTIRCIINFVEDEPNSISI